MAIAVTVTQGSVQPAFAFTSQVSADDTVVIGARTYTFKVAPSSAYEVDIGTDLDGSIQNLVAAINADNSGETGDGGSGEAYGADTEAHPLVTATADTANDEVDLTARGAGIFFDHIYLAATSPGANDISAGGVTVAAAITAGAGTNGVGSIDDWVTSLLDLNQINAEVQYHLKQLTDAAD